MNELEEPHKPHPSIYTNILIINSSIKMKTKYIKYKNAFNKIFNKILFSLLIRFFKNKYKNIEGIFSKQFLSTYCFIVNL